MYVNRVLKPHPHIVCEFLHASHCERQPEHTVILWWCKSNMVDSVVICTVLGNRHRSYVTRHCTMLAQWYPPSSPFGGVSIYQSYWKRSCCFIHQPCWRRWLLFVCVLLEKKFSMSMASCFKLRREEYCEVDLIS